MRTFYPEISPYMEGFLDVGDGNSLHWEISGNPSGKPVVFLHGGPGAGSKPEYRRLFDPRHYSVILFDQRNCGKSLPHASEPGVDLNANTTWHLIADIEKLRESLGIERWMVAGGSWGVTLALAYAQKHPDRVTEMILRGIFTARRAELLWAYQEGASWLFPDHFEDFVAPIPEDERHDLLEAYHRRLSHEDRETRLTAAVAWGRWEGTILTLLPDAELVQTFSQDDYAAAIARIENHYFVQGAFLEEGQLINEAAKLAGIPVVLVQGRYDAVCPARTAWDLHRALPDSELFLVDDAGHAYDQPGILHQLIEASDRFARRNVDHTWRTPTVAPI
ncbi:prolyl aminopeptidase [Catellatospora tritici]|uniref:prolyl aminopeptidase n=1 Tax=Catellatospora tritici TaxID=2851566 RepID=UPI001C2D8C11|nr:prolyl aminopeptidase [Catellatospora tritici]MBV1855012.1 prolyl aminopeptidase [Catellatospora tritici]